MKRYSERFIGFWMGMGVVFLFFSVQYYFHNPEYGRLLTDSYPIGTAGCGVTSLLVAWLAIKHNDKLRREEKQE